MSNITGMRTDRVSKRGRWQFTLRGFFLVVFLLSILALIVDHWELKSELDIVRSDLQFARADGEVHREAVAQYKRRIPLPGADWEHKILSDLASKHASVSLDVHAKTLQEVSIFTPWVNDAYLKDLGAMQNLRRLSLEGLNRINPTAFRHLNNLKRLESLTCSWPSVTDEALRDPCLICVRSVATEKRAVFQLVDRDSATDETRIEHG